MYFFAPEAKSEPAHNLQCRLAGSFIFLFSHVNRTYSCEVLLLLCDHRADESLDLICHKTTVL